MIKRKDIRYYKTQNNNKFSNIEFRKAIELKRLIKTNKTNKDDIKS